MVQKQQYWFSVFTNYIMIIIWTVKNKINDAILERNRERKSIYCENTVILITACHASAGFHTYIILIFI